MLVRFSRSGFSRNSLMERCLNPGRIGGGVGFGLRVGLEAAIGVTIA